MTHPVARFAVLFLAMLAAANLPSQAVATEIVLKDGRVARGKLGQTSGLAEGSQPSAQGAIQSILFLDDNLRRVFLSRRQVREVREEVDTSPVEVFRPWQRVRSSGVGIGSVGSILKAGPFDSYGRRTVTVLGERGQMDVPQGITELGPHWVKVEGITHAWDMRIPPSSIPTATLGAILNQLPNAQSIEHQKKIARFYVQMQRYEDALPVLQKLLADHPGDPQVKEQTEQSIRQLRQLSAQRLLGELKYRREAGQHALVLQSLKVFPSEGVAGEILEEVRELITEYESLQSQRAEVLRQIGELVGQITEPSVQKRLAPVVEEIAAELNLNTLPRMAAFRLAAADAAMLPGEKLGLAASGWLLGSDAATPNLQVALSAWRVRELVGQYIGEPVPTHAAEILQQLASEEAASPKTVALLLANMKPPKPSEAVAERPGYFEIEVPGVDKEPPVRYAVQLPPEYDPHRLYPAVLTLHGGAGAALQIDWWAGEWTEGGARKGQASRHGTIVVAPDWTTEHQPRYAYSAREHAAVLSVLRDACRRFAIDTDRVFLSGHSMGGDAAWDIALAHPDLWAGVIPIAARSDRYCTFYWENAENVPLYVLGGEKDGRWLVNNAVDLDRMLRRGFNVTVIEYLGRGHEHFYDEIQNLFEWMKAFRRNFYPREFTCASMRPWDNFFWWAELADLPARSMVDPTAWPPPRGTSAMRTEGMILANNGVRVRTGADKVIVWLSPQIVDFDQPVSVLVNGRRRAATDPALKPNLGILLEDARTRADRRHPFWTKVEVSTGRD